MLKFITYLKNLKEAIITIGFFVAMSMTVINWYEELDKRISNLESDSMKLKIEYRIMYRNSLLRNKIRIEREIKELTEKENQLTSFEREKLTELLIEREKIIIELDQLTK